MEQPGHNELLTDKQIRFWASRAQAQCIQNDTLENTMWHWGPGALTAAATITTSLAVQHTLLPPPGHMLDKPYWIIPAGLGFILQLETSLSVVPDRIARWEPIPDSPFERALARVERSFNEPPVDPQSCQTAQAAVQARYARDFQQQRDVHIDTFISIIQKPHITRNDTKTLWETTKFISEDPQSIFSATDMAWILLKAIDNSAEVDEIPPSTLAQMTASVLVAEFDRFVHAKTETHTRSHYFPHRIYWKSLLTSYDFINEFSHPTPQKERNRLNRVLGAREASVNFRAIDAPDEFLELSDAMQEAIRGEWKSDNLIELLRLHARMLAIWEPDFTWRDDPSEWTE